MNRKCCTGTVCPEEVMMAGALWATAAHTPNAFSLVLLSMVRRNGVPRRGDASGCPEWATAEEIARIRSG